MNGLGILLAHLVGDYLLQTHWMATEKTKRWAPAAVHALTYGVPYLFLTQSPAALVVIVGTHAVIDRYRLARHVVWFKNQFAPIAHRHSWLSTECGYPPGTPAGLAVALMIVAGNTLHLLINAASIAWL